MNDKDLSFDCFSKYEVRYMGRDGRDATNLLENIVQLMDHFQVKEYIYIFVLIIWFFRILTQISRLYISLLWSQFLTKIKKMESPSSY